MPRVSQEHRENRRRQILDAARRCFVRKGFHGTSIQDVLVEADLSAGALYRYFASKDDIIAAVATDGLAGIVAAFDETAGRETLPRLDTVMDRMFRAVDGMAADQSLPNIALHAWAEALHSPPVNRHVTHTIDVVHRRLTVLIEAHQRRAGDRPAVPADHVARALAGMVAAYIVQHALIGPAAAADLQNGLRALLTGEV